MIKKLLTSTFQTSLTCTWCSSFSVSTQLISTVQIKPLLAVSAVFAIAPRPCYHLPCLRLSPTLQFCFALQHVGLPLISTLQLCRFTQLSCPPLPTVNL